VTLGVTVRSILNCTWYAVGVGFAFALGACGAPSSIEPAPALDAPHGSLASGDLDPESSGDQPGETIEHPTEFSAALFVPIECLDMDAIAAELWAPATASAHGGGVTFVAVDAAMVDLRSLEPSAGESAATNFDAWDRVEAPDRSEFDGFDMAPVSDPDT
jgi:hypothetical protein